MPFLLRVLPTGVAAVLLALRLAAQAPAPAAGDPTGIQPELQAELDALQASAWLPSSQLRASLGWRDNILLSPFAPIERAFGRMEAEAMLWRPMRHHWEFLSFANADILRYFSPPPETSGEQQWSLHADGRWQPVDAFRLSLKATGYLQDMVIDLSETEAMRVVAPTRVRGAYVTATPRIKLPAGFILEPMARVKRTDYREFPGDYDEAIGGGRLEWRRGEALFVSVAAFEHRRRYAERAQYTAGGRALPGTRLRFQQRVGEAKIGGGWTAAGRWNVAATIGRLENRDEASGYFDYDQDRARVEAGWSAGLWRVSFDGETKRMEYLVQTVGAGIAPPSRIADDHDLALRVQREMNDNWIWFVEHRWERSRSNEVEFSYRANTALGGVQRTF